MKFKKNQRVIIRKWQVEGTIVAVLSARILVDLDKKYIDGDSVHYCSLFRPEELDLVPIKSNPDWKSLWDPGDEEE